jgi:XRE family transcriptional regulator, fatty acid utilization regulator
LKEENVRLILGLKVRQLRLEQSLSLQELSGRTGISVSYLNEIEKGKKRPKAEKISSLSDALGVSYDWLVSLQLNSKLSAIGELLSSDILSELPLDIFGLEPSDLLELLTHAPAKLGAFVSTLIEVSRSYDMKVQQFHFSALRAYQEMHGNYFHDIELLANSFCRKFNLPTDRALEGPELLNILQNHFNVQVIEDGLSEFPELSHLRSVTKPGKPFQLLLNKNINKTQYIFALAREIGYHSQSLVQRPLSSPIVTVDTFDEVINYFKASYFAGAVLQPQHRFKKDLRNFFTKKKWNGNELVSMMSEYNVSPEIFLERMTNLLPRHFNLHEIFYLRFNKPDRVPEYNLTKELHLSGLQSPHAVLLNEHYCRRWVSFTILNEVTEKWAKGAYDKPVAGIQYSNYVDTHNRYLVITLGKPMYPTPGIKSSISIGIRVNESLKKAIKFWNDPNISERTVGETCERCSLDSCKERVAPPKVLAEQSKLSTTVNTLNAITSS